MKRLIEPALDFTQLPKIDLILLSHAHFDISMSRRCGGWRIGGRL
jgi:L-ascorbate metabolism protein UlaG (beta-lactamase superfamily)